MRNKITIYTDAGARGNPGPAAAGVVMEGRDSASASWRKEYGQFLGEMTNNEAEYHAVIFALKKLKQLIGSEKCAKAEVEINVDSELLARQVNGEYKIKEAVLQKLFVEFWNMRLDFGKVTVQHVYREENERADEIVNQMLDQNESRLDI